MMDQVLFQSFPYSLESYGTESTVEAITPEALKSWYDTYVHNKKPLVAIIGDTKGTSLATVFVQRFSGSRFQETKIPDSYAKPLEKGGSAKLGWKRSESLILFGFQAPPEDDEDGYAVAVLQGYAGGPGRLSQELRDRLGVAHRVSVQYKPRLRGGGLIISAAASPGGEEKLLEALREEIKQARTGPISFRDFRSAVNEALGTYAIQQQLRSVQIGDVAEYVFAGKGINQLQNYPVGLQEVREEDLDAAIQRFLDPDRSVVVQVIGSSN
jgi:zinc protease